MRGVLKVSVGDVVKLRKPHPCGGENWEVWRVGADIGIKCTVCGRRVMLERRRFENCVKELVSRSEG